MKKLTLALAALIAIASCSKQPEGEDAETKNEQIVKKASSGSASYSVDAANSVINWLGTKPSGQHHGTVKLKAGQINVKNGVPEAGSIQIDMTSIKNQDLEDPEMNQKLISHLKSEDFFHTKEYPEAIFEITKVKPLSGASTADNGVKPTHKVSGNLTIRGNTNNISFKAAITVDGDKLEAESVKFVIDRTKWDVNYQSKSVFNDLKEKFIHDDISLEIKLVANKK